MSMAMIALGQLLTAGCASSVPTDPTPPQNPRMGSDMGLSPPGDGGHLTLDMAGSAACTVVPQAGCPAGFKCTTYDYATTTCDFVGQAARGSQCGQTPDSCQAGLLCVNESMGTGSAPTQCRAFCNTDQDCGPASYCDIALHGGLALCTQACDPTVGTSCESGLGCYLYGAEHSDCVQPGTVAAGGACRAFSDCQPGLFCSITGGAGHCYPVCRRSTMACPAGSACTAIRDGNTQWQTFGVCCPPGGC